MRDCAARKPAGAHQTIAFHHAAGGGQHETEGHVRRGLGGERFTHVTGMPRAVAVATSILDGVIDCAAIMRSSDWR